MSEPGPASRASEIIDHLRSLRDERNIEGMGRYGIDTTTALGISNAVLRPLARQLKRNHERAQMLWDSGIREARLLAAFTDEPKKVTAAQRGAGPMTSIPGRSSTPSPISSAMRACNVS